MNGFGVGLPSVRDQAALEGGMWRGGDLLEVEREYKAMI